MRIWYESIRHIRHSTVFISVVMKTIKRVEYNFPIARGIMLQEGYAFFDA